MIESIYRISHVAPWRMLAMVYKLLFIFETIATQLLHEHLANCTANTGNTTH